MTQSSTPISDPRLIVCDHPVAGHLLSDLRHQHTPPERYRVLSRRLAMVLALEATSDAPTGRISVPTPLEEVDTDRLSQPFVAVPILRAGLGLLEAVTDLLPDVGVGYVGLERDEETLKPVSYYFKTPDLTDAQVLLLDPMLATGGSASFAVDLLRQHGATRITLISVIAAPEGIQRLLDSDPDVRIVTAAVDRELNDDAYIVPGLGDYGDRLFGTF